MPKISIVVPVYNCEPFLEQCLLSVQAQVLSDFEVLLVNDGSTDGGGTICDRFALLDPRFRVFHKANGGVSSARNQALDAAQGECVVFIDADDYVEPDFLTKLVEPMASHDVAVCAYDRVRPDGTQPFVLGDSGELSMKALYEHTLCTQMVGGGCCNKAFRMALIRNFRLRFDGRIAVGEDMLFLVQYYRHCRSAWLVGDVLYHYRFNQVSATESSFAQKRVDQRTASILLAVESMAAHTDPDVAYQLNFVQFRKARSSLRLFFQMVLSRTNDPAIFSSLERITRDSLMSFLGSNHARPLEKVVALSMAFSTRFSFAFAVRLSGALAGRLAAYRT